MAHKHGKKTFVVAFRHPNAMSVKNFLRESVHELGRKDMTRPLQVLEDNWVRTVGDLRLLVQEQQLRTLGLPLRLCAWMEGELGKQDGSAGGAKAFAYQKDFDTNGVVYYIATQGGNSDWQNPAAAGYLSVTSSAMLADSVPAASIVGREATRCITAADGWFVIDLHGRRVVPTQYTLRHYSSWDTEALRNWVLEGSLNGQTWHILSDHQNDTFLNDKGSTHTWDVDAGPEPGGYSMFRLRLTGPNSNGHNYMACSGFEIYGTLYERVANAANNPDVPADALSFAPTAPMDENGIVYHLATAGKTKPWANPMKNGLIIVEASSIMRDSQPLSAVVGRESVRCVTKPQPGSWISVRFVQHRVMPTHYTLRHYSSWDTEALRFWRFEGSRDGHNWVILREHRGDTSLSAKGQAATWAIPDAFHSQMFSHFRVIQTRPNSNNHNYLACSGFEVYGRLVSQAAGAGAGGPRPSINLGDARGPLVAQPRNNGGLPAVGGGGGGGGDVRTCAFAGTPFSESGIVHQIGTNFGARAFMNPAQTSPPEISVRASSVMADSVPMAAVLGKEVVRCVTKPHPQSWIVISFENRSVRPTHYALRHYSSWDVEALRKWTFEASNDGRTWVALRKHTDDTSLARRGAEATWPLETSEYWRMFRIFQWGTNSNNHNYLACSGFEIYGELMEGAPAAPQAAAAVPQDALCWSPSMHSASIALSDNNTVATNTGSRDKWQMVRSEAVVSSGQYRFAVRISEDAATTNTWRFIVGVIPASFPKMGKEWVGAHGSWGYIAGTGAKCHNVAQGVPYGQSFGGGDVVCVDLDFDVGSITFVKNGVSQGVAFSNLSGPVHLAASFTGTNAALTIVDPNDLPAVMPSRAWDPEQCSPVMSIVNDNIVVNNSVNDKWQAVRGVRPYSSGVHTFQVRVLASPKTANNWRFIVGVVPPKFALTWVGQAGGWGYIAGTGGKVHRVGSSLAYGEKWGAVGDVITVVLDFPRKTISFMKNGKDQGVAFVNLSGPVFPAASLTANKSQLELIMGD